MGRLILGFPEVLGAEEKPVGAVLDLVEAVGVTPDAQPVQGLEAEAGGGLGFVGEGGDDLAVEVNVVHFLFSFRLGVWIFVSPLRLSL